MPQATTMNTRALLAKLRDAGFATEFENAESMLEQSAKEQYPFYLNIILFFGAGIAAIFVTAIFAILGLIDFDKGFSLIAWGLVFVGSALILYRLLSPRPTLRYMFFTQLSLVLMIVGKLFVAFGLFSYFDAFWGVPLGLFVLTLATYYLYPMALDRFSSSSLVLLMTIPTFFYFSSKGYDADLLVYCLYAFVLFQLVLLGILLSHPKSTYTYEPLIYALVLSLGVSISVFTLSDSLLLFIDMQIPFSLSMYSLLFSFSILKVMFICALIFLMLWLVGDWRKIFTRPFIIITIGIIVLGFITVSGILFSLGILVLGHARRERLLTFFGGCFLGVFFWKYYYFLPISLEEKAGILMLTGIILLLGRYYIMRQWGNRDSQDSQSRDNQVPVNIDTSQGVAK